MGGSAGYWPGPQVQVEERADVGTVRSDSLRRIDSANRWSHQLRA
jgi:hypothetical protein